MIATISSCHFRLAASSSSFSQIAHEPPYDVASIESATSGCGSSRFLGPVLWQKTITDFGEGASTNLSRKAIRMSDGLAREHWFSQRLRWFSGQVSPEAIASRSKLEGSLKVLASAFFTIAPCSSGASAASDSSLVIPKATAETMHNLPLRSLQAWA